MGGCCANEKDDQQGVRTMADTKNQRKNKEKGMQGSMDTQDHDHDTNQRGSLFQTASTNRPTVETNVMESQEDAAYSPALDTK